VPDGVWVPLADEVRFVALPPPSQEEVERLVAVVRQRVLRLLENRGALPAEGPDDVKQAYQVHSLQQRLRFPEMDVRPPPRKVPRCAFQEGFSLHANTHLHANDREGLERLCRYGARGALALERFEEGEGDTLLYRMKRAMPDEATHLRFTGLELLRRMAALVPPPRRNLVRFHGVVAPGARLRPSLVPAAAAPPVEESAGAAAGEGQGRRAASRTPRLDWAGLLKRTFKQDVLACARCGGRRRVVAYLTHGPVTRQVLEHLELPADVPPLAPARGPPQPDFCQ
jgi:hypothetical protein